MKENVNIALQILPFTKEDNNYEIIDRAIQKIRDSGLRFHVCPFETVIEGPYDEIMGVVKDVYDICFNAGAIELIANLKVHLRRGEDITLDEKMAKYW